MLKFIDDKDYGLLTHCKQTDPEHIEWRYVQGESTIIGSFLKGTPEFEKCQTLCPLFYPLDGAEHLNKVKADKNAAIDEVAGTVRNSYISPGTLIEEEYHIAEQEAWDWDGVSEPIPLSIQIRSDAIGITPLEARDEIRTISAQWKQVLLAIRRIRLTGKAEVSKATTVEEAEQALSATLTAFDAMVNTETRST